MNAGLRSWLNIGVLAFTFVIIVFYSALIEGWSQHAKKDQSDWEFGHGQIWQKDYDPYDPFTIQDGHDEIPENSDQFVPILLQQATIYPEGRMVPITLKGIQTNQKTLKLPTQDLEKNTDIDFPIMLGKRMAKTANLEVGDQVLVRWRDKDGTYDASSATVISIFDSSVGSIDQGQVWLSIKKLWQMTNLKDEATILVVSNDEVPTIHKGWNYQSKKVLFKDVDEMIEIESIGSKIIYLVLLAIALLAIFDTQVLSIFRRQKEIGTLISLGMTRKKVAQLFTSEGTMYSFIACVIGCIIGAPLVYYFSKVGIDMPEGTDDMINAMGKKMYTDFSVFSFLKTIFLVVVSATIVSFLPARKIAKMNPVNALKGKIQ